MVLLLCPKKTDQKHYHLDEFLITELISEYLNWKKK